MGAIYFLVGFVIGVIGWLVHQHSKRIKDHHEYEKAMLNQALIHNDKLDAQYKQEPAINHDQWLEKMKREGHDRGFLITTGGSMMPDSQLWGPNDLAKTFKKRKNFWDMMHKPVDWDKELNELKKNRPLDGEGRTGSAQG